MIIKLIKIFYEKMQNIYSLLQSNLNNKLNGNIEMYSISETRVDHDSSFSILHNQTEENFNIFITS